MQPNRRLNKMTFLKIGVAILALSCVTVFADTNSSDSNNAEKAPLCSTTTGQPTSSIILDIPESAGSAITQSTSPAELPIVGDPWNEIELKLLQGDNGWFRLNGKRLQLVRPLDRDGNPEEGSETAGFGSSGGSSLVLQVTCTPKKAGNSSKTHTLPLIIRISDLNDNPPKFLGAPYTINVSESTPVGTLLSPRSLIRAVDIDAGVNGLVEYFLQDPSGTFKINSPHQGGIVLERSLDFERGEKKFEVLVTAGDRAFDPAQRLSSTTTLTIHVVDDDDQPPEFNFKEYNATVVRSVLTGVLDVRPERVRAVDKDTLNSKIEYSFINGTRGYQNYFVIDKDSGLLRQTHPLTLSTDPSHFQIFIKATEKSGRRHFAVAKLNVFVSNLNTHPPEISASSLIGVVAESSPEGTTVISKDERNRGPIRFTVRDDDLSPSDPRPDYEYELTSPAFRVNSEGILVVADGKLLDRDPPVGVGVVVVQIIAREKSAPFSSSSPVVIHIHLLDLNDNGPKIKLVPEPIVIPAGDVPGGKRRVFKVIATDRDPEQENSEVTYRITHVSNNGTHRFQIDARTGVIEALGKFNTGESFSLGIEASDGKHSTHALLSILVTDGPNRKPPQFSQPVYDVSVSEGASIGSEIVTLEARDPEGKSVLYEIVAGNELGHFSIGEKSGVVRVRENLDREDLGKYSLIIRATDGELSSTTTLNLRINDINDQNPIFLNTPFKLNAKESTPPNTRIGQVSAKDMDTEFGRISYSLDDNSPFKIDSRTGEIFTKGNLDFEREKVHYVVVTARDNGNDPRIATATVTITVEDVPDTPPVFIQFSYEFNIEENLKGVKVGSVEALDPDTTTKKITYYIKQGPLDKFKIDPITGEIFTKEALDYEREMRHVLIIGTEENEGFELGSTATVSVNVRDVNDVPPMFTILPRPITIQDTTSIGSVITRLEAADSDGTSPFNKVFYQLTGKGKALKYFDVDHETGEITVKDDLRREIDSVYTLSITASDLGEPPLSSTASVRINVDHVATVKPDIGVGFSESLYTVEVSESSPGPALVKSLVIVNKQEGIPLECRIREGNYEGLFKAEINQEGDRNCDVSLTRASLDAEKVREFELSVELLTLPGVISKKNSISRLKIRVLDENDNHPEFPLKKYFAGVDESAEIGTQVIRIEATDRDSGDYKEINYSLEAENDLAKGYFQIDAKTGIISTSKLLDDVGNSILPFRFQVVAKDDPRQPTKGQTSKVPLIINLVSDTNRLVLVIQGTTPDKVKLKEKEIRDILQENSEYIILIEKITAHNFVDERGILETDSSATDVWFYGVDPVGGWGVDNKNNNGLGGGLRSLLAPSTAKSISYYVSSTLGVRATEVKRPISKPKAIIASPIGTSMESDLPAFPAALVALACLIFVITTAGICFICYKYSRYTAFKEEKRIIAVPGGPGGRGHAHPTLNYEPFYDSSPSLKEYETQVLNMRVSEDVVDDEDLQVDLRRIGDGRRHDWVGMGTAGSQIEGSISGGSTIENRERTPVLKTFQRSVVSADVESVSNPIYERSSDDDEDNNATNNHRYRRSGNKMKTEL